MLPLQSRAVMAQTAHLQYMFTAQPSHTSCMCTVPLLLIFILHATSKPPQEVVQVNEFRSEAIEMDV